MKKLTVLTLLLVFVFAAGAFARQHGYGKHNWWENEETVKSVGLSEDQLAELKKIDESYTEQFSKLHEEIKKLHMELRDLMSDPKSSNEDITAKHNEMIAKKDEKMSLKLEKKLKMRGVLNPDQIVKLSEIKKQQMTECKGGKDCPYKEGMEGKECSYKESDESGT